MTRLGLIPTTPPRGGGTLDRVTPVEAIERWPVDLPLAALVSADDDAARAGDPGPGGPRWSILGAPTRTLRLGADDLDPVDPLGALREALASPRSDAPDAGAATVPFVSGWIGSLGYELGGLLEPRARRQGDDTSPLIELHRCPGAFVHDRVGNRWSVVGDGAALPDLSAPPVCGGARESAGAFSVGPARSDLGRRGYEEAVARAIEYIRAGDVFQVNVAHALTASFSGDPRAMFARMIHAARPWYGAYVESRDPEDSGESGVVRAVCSISPELFLEFDARTRRVVTRPIKGTSAADAPEGVLRDSEKDAAELVMIVDLMRNDLGRVCVPGSIRVVEPRRIERHAGVRHGVATVEGVLREGLDRVDLIRAAFPAGSITGAPKVRAMQIINELEPSARGAYCGAIGWFGDDGSMTLNVAIRTACVSGGVVRYNAGAGIVADSDPAAEWLETMHKAEAFLGAVGSSVEGAER